jgi:hypothetical protein
MNNKDTQDFFVNLILIVKHPVGGLKFEIVHALFFQIIRYSQESKSQSLSFIGISRFNK